MNSTNKLLPMRVSVTLRGGIEDIARLAPENVRVSVEYSEIISTQSGFLKPSVYAPSGVQVVGIYPRAVRIMRSVSGRSFL
jgi:hypothetical protein